MISNIPYYKNRTLNNVIYSVDMLTLQGYGNCPNFRLFCEKWKIPYESGESHRKNKYCNVFGFINFDTVGVDIGEFIGRGEMCQSYFDDNSEKWVIKSNTIVNAPMWKIRFNPNKICNRPWFNELVELLSTWSDLNAGMLYIIKVDLACDLIGNVYNVVVRTRKEPSMCKGTKYYGKSGRNGYVKIYDKGKEIGDNPKEHFRIEYTFVAPFDIKFDDITYLNKPLEIKDVFDELIYTHCLLSENGIYNDILEHLRTENFRKIKSATSCDLVTLEYEPFNELVQEYCDMLHCSISGTKSNESDIRSEIDFPIDIDDD